MYVFQPKGCKEEINLYLYLKKKKKKNVSCHLGDFLVDAI